MIIKNRKKIVNKIPGFDNVNSGLSEFAIIKPKVKNIFFKIIIIDIFFLPKSLDSLS